MNALPKGNGEMWGIIIIKGLVCSRRRQVNWSTQSGRAVLMSDRDRSSRRIPYFPYLEAKSGAVSLPAMTFSRSRRTG